MPTRKIAAAVVISVAAGLVLAGCIQQPPEVIPTSEPSSKPVFTSNAAALAAAKKAYVAYLAVSDEVSNDGGANAERLAPVVTTSWLPTELKSYKEFAKSGDKTTGSSSVRSFTLEQLNQSTDRVEVVAYACLDLSATGVVDSVGNAVGTPGSQGVLPLEVSFIGAKSDSQRLILDRSAPWSGQNFCGSASSSSPSSSG
jgi:hypothetical protein